MIKKPLWIKEDLQKKIMLLKSLLGCGNVEDVLIKLGIIEKINKEISDYLKKQTESTQNEIKQNKQLNKIQL